MVLRLIPAAVLLLCSAPAFATGSESVPEAPAATLFALGLLGVIVGRKASMKQKDKRED